MLSLFPMSGYVYMYVRNIGVVSVPCEWSCIFVSENIDVVSVPCCVVMYICVRNIDVVSVHCEWSCIYVYQEYRCCLCSM